MKKKQTRWLDNFGKADNANESNVSLSDNFNGLSYDTSYRDYSPAWGGQFQQGGTLPGSVGFTYARTAGAAPSEGPYAKKTLPSAQNGVIADKIAGLELKMSPEYQYRKYLESLPQVKQAPGRGEELLRKGLGYADVATDVMQFGNFVPIPQAQFVGKIGNIAGSLVDLTQAGLDFYSGDVGSGSVNLASAALPSIIKNPDVLGGYKRSAKYAFGNRSTYLPIDKRYGRMTEKQLLGNRALFGALGAETVYDSSNPKFQNGGEMKFYQEGLDWKPKSMQYGGSEKISTSDPRYPELYKNRQVGAYYDGAFTLPDLPEVTVTAPRSYTMQSLRDATTAALYGAPANVMKMELIPQALMTEGIEMLRGKPYDFSNVNPNFGSFTSNQRDPSMTMGYENPEGFLQNAANIGLSMIEPSLISGLTSSSIGKRVAKDITKDIVNPNKIVFDLMDESIDPFGEVLKTIKTHQGPTPFAKDVKREAYKYQELTSDPRYLERVRRVDEDFGSALEFKLDKFNNYENENTETYFPFNISTTDDLPSSISEGDQALGVSKPILESELKDYARKEGIYVTNYDPATDREIIINEKAHLQGNEPARGTVHHELKHHWTNALKDEYGLENQKAYRKALSDLIIPESANEFLPRKNYEYYSNPTEIDAHLMTNMRDEMVKRGYLKDHFDELTKDKLNDFILKERDYRGVKEYFSPGREMIFDRSKFVNFFNKYGLPSTVIGGVAGSQALDQKRDGGIVKDNQGYWNPDNWGNPVEIGSNNITMQGVYEPLLGISDTGDTKLMKPGKNYKFKGSKVTEFPVAELGINQLDAQPMKKLNQLLNFTNNPDKTNWLDKYQ